MSLFSGLKDSLPTLLLGGPRAYMVGGTPITHHLSRQGRCGGWPATSEAQGHHRTVLKGASERFSECGVGVEAGRVKGHPLEML